jgi:hypothetical protein
MSVNVNGNSKVFNTLDKDVIHWYNQWFGMITICVGLNELRPDNIKEWFIRLFACNFYKPTDDGETEIFLLKCLTQLADCELKMNTPLLTRNFLIKRAVKSDSLFPNFECAEELYNQTKGEGAFVPLKH